MTYRSKVKRAMFDKNLYNGSTTNDEWGLRETLAYSNFCDRFGGHFTAEPSSMHQSPEFMKLVDSYEDLDYATRDVEVDTEDKPKAGVDLRQFVPERQPINTEGLSKEEIKQADAVLNENAIRLKAAPIETKPVTPPAEIKEITLDDKGSASSKDDGSNEETSNNNSGSGEDSKSSTETTDGKASEPTVQTQSKSQARNTQNVNRNGAIKTR
jgi:hypothetical protein